MLTDGSFPLGLWWPPPPEETSVAAYRRIAEAGFTFVIGGNGVDTPARNLRLLAAAEANGLGALVQDARVGAGRAALGAATAEYARHRSFAGYLLVDEPGARGFSHLAEVSRMIEEVAPGRLPYINLFPNYASPAQLQAPSYRAYLEDFCAQVRPQVLSFDHYPLLDDGSLDPGYFANWAEIRRAALMVRIPSWVFLQAIGFLGRRAPTPAEILWQANVALAFGAKGLMYFTYWTPEGSEQFTTALIDRSGRPTTAYDAAVRINRHLAATGARLLPLCSEGVASTAVSPSAGLDAFHPDGWITELAGDPVILGRFSPGSGPGRERWLLLTNGSPGAPARVDLAVGPRVTELGVFDPAAGVLREQRMVRNRPPAVVLEPGAAVLYRLRAG